MPKRVDVVQAELVATLRAVGGDWLDTHELGHGAPDGLAVFRGRYYLAEIKGPHGKLTADQVRFHAHWPGPIYIWRTVDQMLRDIGAVDERPAAIGERGQA